MKRAFITALAIFLLSTTGEASYTSTDEGNWTRTFRLDNGLSITHDSGISLNIGGLKMRIGNVYQFSAGSSLNGCVASADGLLVRAMSLDKFRQEVQKLGKIISEK